MTTKQSEAGPTPAKRKHPSKQHADTQKQVQIEQRRKVVAANLLAGATYREIAAACDVSPGTVSADVRAVVGQWRQHYANKANRWLSIQLRRYDVLLNAIWDRAREGDVPTIECALRIMERQNRLLDLDAPVRHKVTLVSLTADDLAKARDEAEAFERAQLGAAPGLPPEN